MTVDAARVLEGEREHAMFELDIAQTHLRVCHDPEAARILRDAELLARWWGAWEPRGDRDIIVAHRAAAVDELVDAWLKLQAVMATSPDDRTELDIAAAEARLRIAIFDAQEWGLCPDRVVEPFDPEGKF